MWPISVYTRPVNCFQDVAPIIVVRDSSAVWRLLWICCSRGTSEGCAYGKQLICLSNSWSAHFHVSWLSNFIFYRKPLYKSLHQWFFYSFMTILPSESGVTLHYSTILLPYFPGEALRVTFDRILRKENEMFITSCTRKTSNVAFQMLRFKKVREKVQENETFYNVMY